ncbi:hypothetical protein [uncultured Sunxiuqinia sp.]|uniref:hypothetical protein n=1 Tax=uncultured Sunxiuqinia sp. TaxID=1573825 RepID=UPI002AA8DE05|nr:hypothetical protein [uncultured Sunxiuqinia sp.]
MEDYIFIIIAIVLSIVGALNQNKKKKAMQEQQNGDEQHQEPSFFEQIFNDPVFQEEEIQVEKVPTRAARPEVKKSEKRVPHKPLQSSIMKKTEISGSINDNIGEEEYDETQETTRESIMNGFSLKKAVIYSEIINRKY